MEYDRRGCTRSGGPQVQPRGCLRDALVLDGREVCVAVRLHLKTLLAAMNELGGYKTGRINVPYEGAMSNFFDRAVAKRRNRKAAIAG